MSRWVDRNAIEKLAQNFRGVLFQAEDAGYEDARKVWNGMMDDRRPCLIARCSGTADVVAAVRFAREHGILPAIRGGGHSAAGKGTCDGGMVIDLSAMRSVFVNPQQRTAIAQGGALWGDYDRETQMFGLASPGGVVSTTGIGGFTLGGGIGWLTRRFGLACDNLIGVDLVTADGNHRLVTNESDPELMWALRGGGGNFGVATSLHYKLHAVGPIVFGGPLVFSLEHAEEVFALVDDAFQTAPDELGIGVVVSPIKPVALFPVEMHWRPIVAVVLCWTGDLTQGEKVVAPFRQIGRPLLDGVGPISYETLQKGFDDLAPAGRRSYWKSGYLRELSPRVAQDFVKYGAEPQSPYSQVEAQVLGGAFGRIGHDDTAFGDRTGRAIFNVEGLWLMPEDDEANVAWAHNGFADLERYSTGTAYVNFLSEEGDDRVRAAYGAKYYRLARVKAKYDPDNFFRINQNIVPSASA